MAPVGTGTTGTAGTGSSSVGDVVVRDVVRRVPGGRVVLDRVTATFPAGEVSVVHGSNGSGKSVLSRVLARVDRPDAGSVSAPPTAAYLLPERAAVVPGVTARLLAHGLAATVGRDTSEWPVRLTGALERLRSTHGPSTPLHRLSKGNLQKAYLGIAYALRPAVAVLDEPMSGLDTPAMAAALELVRELARDGGVVVVTAHRAGRLGDTNRLLAGGVLHEPAAVPEGAFLVDVGPADRALALLAAGALGPGVACDEPAPPERVRLRVGADQLDPLLRAALGCGLGVLRVVEELPW